MQRLVAADELLVHQTPETFATVDDSDLSWTEHVACCIYPRDGSIQIHTGFGKFTNRNMVDMWAGISRGKEQWTVRAARDLESDVDRVGVGPYDFEVVEPLRSVRFVLRPNDVLPLSFDFVARGVLPPFLEDKDWQTEPVGFRVCSNLQRYHQMATAEGWLKVGDERFELNGGWTGFRSHSWGVRMDVGEPPTDVYVPDRLVQNFILMWAPWTMTRPDGSTYGMIFHLQEVDGKTTYFNGFEERADGTKIPLHGMRHELEFDPDNRRLLGGRVHFDAGWGNVRTFEVETIGDTGFHYGPALYFGFKGRRHGTWVGPYLEDGEVYEDCTNPAVARELHQLRDQIVRIREGDAVGYGSFETILTGEFPQYGMKAETSFL